MIGYLTKEEATALLVENSFCHIGCNDGFNTYVYPSNYVFDGNNIFCHSLPGSKIAIMRLNRKVCLQVDEVRAAEDWKSVMVQGQYEEVLDTRERYSAIKAFADHKMHLKVSEDALTGDSGLLRQQRLQQKMRLVIYRIRIAEITGRIEKK
jgi:uncharacterized protein